MRSPRIGLRRAAALAAVVIVGAAVSAAPAAAYSGHGPKPKAFDYYLALGDSLGAGYQPNAVTGQGYLSGKGYADDIAADLKAKNPATQFVNLSCPGETTGSMIHGGCRWPEPYQSQLSAATAFLAAHKNAHVLVTIDIGANNVDGCASATGLDLNCAFQGLGQVASDVPQIMKALRGAAGGGTEFVGSTYYNPYLAAWLTGPSGQQIAKTAALFDDLFNATLSVDYWLHGARVADVAKAFTSDSFTPLVPIAPGVTAPLNVARICQWTWMCAPKPVGPNIHANDAGYAVMAKAFEGVI